MRIFHWLANAFSGDLNTLNPKISSSMVGYIAPFKNIFKTEKPYGVYWNMTGRILGVNPEGVPGVWLFTILLILTWGLRNYLQKRGQQNKGAWIFEVPTANSIRDWGKFHAKPVCFFIIFIGDKKELSFKKLSWLVILTSNFMPWLLDSFDLPNYGSEKIHTKVLLTCLGRGEFWKLFCQGSRSNE